MLCCIDIFVMGVLSRLIRKFGFAISRILLVVHDERLDSNAEMIVRLKRENAAYRGQSGDGVSQCEDAPEADKVC